MWKKRSSNAVYVGGLAFKAAESGAASFAEDGTSNLRFLFPVRWATQPETAGTVIILLIVVVKVAGS